MIEEDRWLAGIKALADRGRLRIVRTLLDASRKNNRPRPAIADGERRPHGRNDFAERACHRRIEADLQRIEGEETVLAHPVAATTPRAALHSGTSCEGDQRGKTGGGD